MTALIPWSFGPLAAQSLDEPDPYSFPARMMVYFPSFMYFSAASKTGKISPEGTCLVIGPTLSAILFTSLTLAKVPLAMTRSFPLLAPYELNSFYSTPLDVSHLAATDVLAMFPAGEI